MTTQTKIDIYKDEVLYMVKFEDLFNLKQKWKKENAQKMVEKTDRFTLL